MGAAAEGAMQASFACTVHLEMTNSAFFSAASTHLRKAPMGALQPLTCPRPESAPPLYPSLSSLQRDGTDANAGKGAADIKPNANSSH